MRSFKLFIIPILVFVAVSLLFWGPGYFLYNFLAYDQMKMGILASLGKGVVLGTIFGFVMKILSYFSSLILAKSKSNAEEVLTIVLFYFLSSFYLMVFPRNPILNNTGILEIPIFAKIFYSFVTSLPFAIMNFFILRVSDSTMHKFYHLKYT